MKCVLALALGVVSMAIAASLGHVLGLEQARIEIAAVLVVYACVGLANGQDALCAFGGGYLEDVLSGHPTGLFPFAAMVAYLLGRIVVVIVDVRGPLGFAALTIVVAAGYQLAALAVLTVFPGIGGGPSQMAITAVVPTALLTGASALLLQPLLHRLDLAFDREESSLSR